MNPTRLAVAAFALGALAFTTAPSLAATGPVTVTMTAQNASGENGTATLTPTPDGVQVVVSLKNAPAAAQPAHIHPGTCANLTPAPQYPLTSLANGTSTTLLKGVTMDQLLANPFAVNVHQSTSNLGTYVSCGDIKSS